ELAYHILNRKQVDLVVSSPVLPDGGVEKLRAKLLELTTPPDLVVVQGLEQIDPNRLRASTQFQVVALSEFDRSREERRPLPTRAPSKTENNPISTLGADIRNDLNNPLQEIVAMVYVARADREVAEGTLQALQA